MTTILYEQRETQVPQPPAGEDDLWLDRDAIEQATGWSWKPEGLCRGDVCVPIPPGAARDLVREGLLNLSRMWGHMGHPVVHDAASTTWVLGVSAGERGHALAGLQAPDFAAPDLDGRMHRLSDYRGRRVFLATWASW